MREKKKRKIIITKKVIKKGKSNYIYDFFSDIIIFSAYDFVNHDMIKQQPTYHVSQLMFSSLFFFHHSILLLPFSQNHYFFSIICLPHCISPHSPPCSDL